MTKRAFVIGQPLAHSLSPAIHNAAFAAIGFDAHYEPAEVPPDELGLWVDRARSRETLGFNVTLPHKETIRAYLDAAEGDGRLTGAVNTVAVAESADGALVLTGTNTDTAGFRRMLADEAGFSLKDQRVVLLGAGGAARAVALVAFQDGAAEIYVVNRHLDRANKLLTDLEEMKRTTRARAMGSDSDQLAAILAAATTVINATSVGLASGEIPVDPTPVRASALVVDLIYNPRETSFLRVAAQQGAKVLGGLGMLVYQAAATFERWTGAEAPIGVMRSAAEAALRERTHR